MRSFARPPRRQLAQRRQRSRKNQNPDNLDHVAALHERTAQMNADPTMRMTDAVSSAQVTTSTQFMTTTTEPR